MRRRILIINNNMDTGGVEIVLQSLCRRLAAGGAELTLWAQTGSRQILSEKYPPDIRWRRWPFWHKQVKRFSPRHFLQKAVELFMEGFLLKLKKWDIIVAFKEGEDMVLASKLRAKRKVAFVHTDYGHFHWTDYCFENDEAERLCMAGFDAVATVSEAARLGLISAIGDPGNLRMLYNPIDYAAIEARSRESEPCRSGEKTLLVSVGRLSKVKRYDMLVDICNELASVYPLELWIVGGGELEAELRQKLEEGNISCVKLWGKKDNPYPYIATADWLISSSETESYGLTVQEALILGVPVIACACPAIAESMDASFGLLCGMEKAELKAAIERALSDSGLAHRCRRAAAENYDKSELWEKRLEELYRFIIGQET